MTSNTIIVREEMTYPLIRPKSNVVAETSETARLREVKAEFAANRERPSSIDLPINATKDDDSWDSQYPTLLSHTVLRKEIKKLSYSRGINLPAIQLNDIPTNNTKKKRHKRGQSLGDIPTKQQFGSLENTGSNRSDAGNSSTATDASDISPASIISPIGHTLKHSEEFTRHQDLNRTIHSESFCIGLDQITRIPYDEHAEAIDIRIFLPNGAAVQFNVLNGIDAAAADLLQLMAEHMKIDDYSVAEETLAIWLVSPLLEIQLKSHHVPYVICQKWPAFLRRFTNADEEEIALDEPLLVLRRNVLLTLNREIQFVEKYERLTEILYFHARDEFLCGRYPVNIETTVQLVGLQLAIEFGPYDGILSEALDLIYESLNELAPAHHVKTIRSFNLFGFRMMECKKGLENRVIDEYQTASKYYQSNYERQKGFLTILRATPFYGAAFYSGTIDKNKMEQKSEGDADFMNVDLDKKRTVGHGRNRRQRTSSHLFDRLRRLLHYRNLNGVKTGARREILIGINHGYITLIDPREHKVLEILKDNSPEGNMSLNDKISLFCAD